MYIYADESGHSGRHIFNDPLFYLQGAIISEIDTEPPRTAIPPTLEYNLYPTPKFYWDPLQQTSAPADSLPQADYALSLSSP